MGYTFIYCWMLCQGRHKARPCNIKSVLERVQAIGLISVGAELISIGKLVEELLRYRTHKELA